jgi:glucan biosynthesis protein
VIGPISRKNYVTGGWRAFVDMSTGGDGPFELLCVLPLAEQTLTETWVYQWSL